MADPIFPIALKPIVTSYSFAMADNVLNHPVSGGSNLQIRDTKLGRVPFQITMVMTPLRMQVWNDFYFGKINGGQDKFIMQLDSGNGIEDHTVTIENATVDQSFNNDPTRVISYVVWAEKTSFQENPYGGGLVDLYDAFGDDLVPVMERLAIYVNEDMPEWIPA